MAFTEKEIRDAQQRRATQRNAGHLSEVATPNVLEITWKHIVGKIVKTVGYVAWVICGLWGFVLDLAVVNYVAGFWGVVLGFSIAPVTFTAAPWYALVAWGTWYPLLICYEGTIVSGAIVWMGSTISGDQFCSPCNS